MRHCWKFANRPSNKVPFGGDRWLFEVLAVRLELEFVRVIDTPEATLIRYRVRR